MTDIEQRRLEAKRRQIAARQARATRGRNPSAVDVAGDVMRSGASGMAQGFTDLLDLPANIPGYVMQGGIKAGEKLGMIDPEFGGHLRDSISEFRQLGGAGHMAEQVAPSVMGYQPETTPGEYAQTGGRFVGGGTPLGGGIGTMLTSGLASEGAGQATEGTQYEPYARILAALAAPSALRGVENVGRRIVTPNPADPARTEAARALMGENVRLTAGQRTGNANLQYREQMVPRTAQMLADQGDDFTAAALRRIGVNARRAEPEVMDAARQRIGGMFDDLASRNSIAADRTLSRSAEAALDTYKANTNKNTVAPIIDNIVRKIRAASARKKPITGQEYQQWRSELGPALRGNDAQLREAAKSVRGALDDAMRRTIKATGNADDLALYDTARQQYRDLLAIEGAVSRAGESTAYGVINPRQLRAEAVRSYGKAGYAGGKSDLGNLARAGNQTMTPLPQSGTQPRLAANTIQALQGGGSGVGAGGLAYLLTKDPTIAAAAGVAGAAAPAVRNSISGSRVGQAYLANQLMPGSVQYFDNNLQAVIAALLAEEKRGQKQQ